jgi:pimeloyl-ACP methyl ester carboxylesterase
MQETNIDVNGTKLHLYEDGPVESKGGETLLFLHGAGGSNWRAIASSPPSIRASAARKFPTG